MKFKRYLLIPLLFGLGGCITEANVASHNLSHNAEQFLIERKITFINGFDSSILLEVVGRCSIEDQVTQLEVTCKTGEEQFKKHFLGLSDNTTYVVEHLQETQLNTYNYQFVVRPQTVIPEVGLDIK